MTIYDRIRKLREEKGMSQQELAERVGFKTASAVNKIELGLRNISQSKVSAFAKALNTTTSYLIDGEGEGHKSTLSFNLVSPNITDDVVTFPVIGSIAAGYNEIAVEDWSGETIDVPRSYLRGRDKSDFLSCKYTTIQCTLYIIPTTRFLYCDKPLLSAAGMLVPLFTTANVRPLRESISLTTWLGSAPSIRHIRPKS